MSFQSHSGEKDKATHGCARTASAAGRMTCEPRAVVTALPCSRQLLQTIGDDDHHRDTCTTDAEEMMWLCGT